MVNLVLKLIWMEKLVPKFSISKIISRLRQFNDQHDRFERLNGRFHHNIYQNNHLQNPSNSHQIIYTLNYQNWSLFIKSQTFNHTQNPSKSLFYNHKTTIISTTHQIQTKSSKSLISNYKHNPSKPLFYNHKTTIISPTHQIQTK